MIVVASTLPTWKMTDFGYWGSWLTNAEAVRESHDEGVAFLAVLETDARGLAPFGPLLDRLRAVDGTCWTFQLDDGAMLTTPSNRITRICTGRNLATHFAQDVEASHILYADADIELPPDVLPRLLEVDWPVVGARVPTYCLEGPPVGDYPFQVTEHMNTAGCMLVARWAFSRLRWRTDGDAGLTDDPCYHVDASALGFPTRVREDCIALHYPENVESLEVRGHDLEIYR